MRAMSRMSSNSRVRRLSSAAAASACARRSSTGSSSRRLSTAIADHGQRRLEIVAERRQQRRRQLAALPLELGGFALFEKLRALDGNAGALLRGRREVAADQRRDQEGEQRHPVVRLGDRERADRREEEIVERQRRGDRDGDGDPQRPERRREQHQDQQRETRCRRIDARNQPQHRHRSPRRRRAPRRRARPSRVRGAWALRLLAILTPRRPPHDGAATFYGFFMSFLCAPDPRLVMTGIMLTLVQIQPLVRRRPSIRRRWSPTTSRSSGAAQRGANT